MSFSNLGLDAPLLQAIEAKGYTKPTPIQQQAIPVILQKKDVLAAAQTGTGKTAGFTLPLLQKLTETNPKMAPKQVRVLVLTPTRELAAQVSDSIELYGANLPYRSMVIFGGVNINPQISKLKRGIDIVIATPGRLLDLLHQRAIDLKAVEILVLDEADRMLDMGFIHDIKRLVKIIPRNRQTLLFSATFSKEIKTLATTFLRNPVLVEVARENSTATKITQKVHLVDKARKAELLQNLIIDNHWRQVLVFTRTKHGANRLTKYLEDGGISTAAIHGNKSQAARTKALAGFKDGSVQILVATDIAARGIDIEQLPHVVNYELPNVPEDYVHRIGRTGRAGKTGHAVSLVCIDEHKLLADIEKFKKENIEKETIAGFEPDPSIKAEPIRNGRGGNGRNNRGGRNGGNGGSSSGSQKRRPQNSNSGHSNRGGSGSGRKPNSRNANQSRGGNRGG